MVQVTKDRYFLDGTRTPYFFGGHNDTKGFFLDVRHGFTDRLELDVQLPYFTITFNDLAADRSSTGFGDLRLGARYKVLEGPLVITLGATVKFPTGQFDNDAEVVPVGEGQYDYELQLELARSLWPRPGYITGMIGYRIRTENSETGIDHGDELFWSLEAGYQLIPKIWFKARWRGLHGFDTSAFGFPFPSLQRRAMYLSPGVIFEVNATRSVEISMPLSLSGKNWPAGPVFNIGIFETF